MNPQRPDWLTESCPRWCASDHDAQRLDADRRHESASIIIPILGRVPSGDAAGIPQAEELGITLHRAVGSDVTWIALATEHQSLELTRESMSIVLAQARHALSKSMAE